MLKTEPDFQVLLGNHGLCVPPDKEQDCPVFWVAQSSNPTSKDRRAGDYLVTLHNADKLLGLKSLLLFHQRRAIIMVSVHLLQKKTLENPFTSV